MWRWSSGSCSTAPSSPAPRRRLRRTLAELPATDIASWLVACAHDELSTLGGSSPLRARADGAAASAMLRKPSLGELRRTHRMLDRPAGNGNAAVLEQCFHADSIMRRTGQRHRSASGGVAGHPEAVRVLLRFGADVNARTACSRRPRWSGPLRPNAQPGADHAGVARVLIEAGSSVEWTPPEGAPGPERTLEGLIELRRAAARPDPG
jgi:hypothetical protein